MRLDQINSQPCPVARAMAVIGDAWSVLVLREAFYGVRRFSEFVEYTGAQRTVVSDRLKRLVASGVLERVEYQQHPSRHEYRLTERGAQLQPVLLALAAWGNNWTSPEAGPLVSFTHTGCGHELGAAVFCDACGEPIDRRNVSAHPGPGYPKDRPDLIAARRNRSRPTRKDT